MKSQPLALALVVMNFALLGYLIWQSHEFVQQRAKLSELLATDKSKTDALLANCVPLRDMQEILRALKGEKQP